MALTGLSRRERQIMEILYRGGKASVSEVMEGMDDAPGYSAVRAMMRVLEDKGHVKHRAEGLKYVYVPVVTREKAKRSAVKTPAGHVLQRGAGPGSRRAAGRLFQSPHEGGIGSHGGNDREGQERG
jgi:predicted transcriptional regulator